MMGTEARQETLAMNNQRIPVLNHLLEADDEKEAG